MVYFHGLKCVSRFKLTHVNGLYPPGCDYIFSFVRCPKILWRVDILLDSLIDAIVEFQQALARFLKNIFCLELSYKMTENTKTTHRH